MQFTSHAREATEQTTGSCARHACASLETESSHLLSSSLSMVWRGLISMLAACRKGTGKWNLEPFARCPCFCISSISKSLQARVPLHCFCGPTTRIGFVAIWGPEAGNPKLRGLAISFRARGGSARLLMLKLPSRRILGPTKLPRLQEFPRLAPGTPKDIPKYDPPQPQITN